MYEFDMEWCEEHKCHVVTCQDEHTDSDSATAVSVEENRK